MCGSGNFIIKVIGILKCFDTRLEIAVGSFDDFVFLFLFVEENIVIIECRDMETLEKLIAVSIS